MTSTSPPTVHRRRTDPQPGPVVGIVDDPRQAEDLAPEWEGLADRCGAGPLARPRHSLAWWQHLGSGRLLVVTVRDAGRLVALAPLHERAIGPIRVVRWLGHGLGTVTQPLVEPGHAAAADLMWEALSARHRVWELVECRDGVEGLPRAGNGRGGRRTVATPRDVCPVADLTGGVAGLLGRPGKKNLRGTLNKCDRRLEQAGSTYRTEVATDLAAFEAQLPDLRAVMDAAEASQPKLHLLAPPYGDFVLDYLRGAIAGGEAVSFVGYIDEAPATMQVCLRQGETLALWIARFDPRFARLSPGHLLYRSGFAWAESVGITRVDLLLGESQTKRHWSTDAYATLEVVSGHPAATACVRGVERLVGAVRRVRT